MNKTHIYYIVWATLLLLVGGCSVESRNPIGKNYHNTTARYNGYFLAREKMKEVEATIAQNMQYDYNQVLEIFPIADATTVASIAPDLDDVIKKASFPIQRHKNSKWVDDSYVLIGKARYYQEDYEEAIKTFKYVNSISTDPKAKHEALVWLMRSFMKNKEFDNAQATLVYLQKQKLNKDNTREFHLTKAQYHRIYAETPKIIESLEIAVPLIRKKDERSRVRFILAQLYQQTGQDQKAYEHYAKILRRNPPYELGFFSKLNLGQVTDLSSASKAKVERYYRKLLKDSKNDEYQDKIYYEMARFELKQKNYEPALHYLRQSTAVSRNSSQKGYSYLLAGRVYFENLQRYRLAQAYYDSAVQVLPQSAPEYGSVKERRDILTDFTTQLTTIETEDSLQVLARMDTASLNRRINELIAQEVKRQQDLLAARQNQQLAEQQQQNTFSINPNLPDRGAPGTTAGGVWYFDNPVTMGTARADFARVWGNRPLQDNWRRNKQRTVATATGTDNTGEDGEAAGAEVAADTIDVGQLQASLRQEYIRNIPFGALRLQQSEERVEEAMFKLANIYNHQLQEPAHAAETFEKLLSRFPNTKHAAETYYSLYLIYKNLGDERQQKYYALLKEQFPKSTFARLLDQPDFLEANTEENVQARLLYDSAFVQYEARKYPVSLKLVNETQRKFPNSVISDKVAFLKVLLIGHTESPAAFKAALDGFMATYPSSPLMDRAQELAETYKLYESGELNKPKEPVAKTTTPAASQANYQTNLQSPHFFVVLYPGDDPQFKNFQDQLSDYNLKNFKTESYTTVPFLFSDKQSLIIVKQFPDSKKAMTYADKHMGPASPLNKIKDAEFKTFIISAENFPIFFKAKNVEEYLSFYRKNYFK